MRKILAMIIAICAITSCKKSGMELSGKIDNAAGESIYLVQMGINGNIVVDSAKIAEDGTFSLTAPKNNKPEFFSANLLNGMKQITFIVDSLTTGINVEADAKAADWFGSIKFANSPESANLQDMIARVDNLQKEYVGIATDKNMSQSDAQAASRKFMDNVASHKEFVQKYIFENPSSFVSYYALFQNVANMSIFNIMNKEDLSLYGTVATNMRLKYPEHERVEQLCNIVLQARAVMRQQQKTEDLIRDAKEVGSPDLNMPDKDGNMHKLSDLHGKIVILQFWASQSEESRKMNRQLAKLYSQYKSRGLEIYQVSFDTSKLLWEEASKNDDITWINVCDLQGSNSSAVGIYNVGAVPSNYIIDRNGQLIGKDLSGTRLDNKMKELL